MMENHNETAHIYDEKIAPKVGKAIIEQYFHVLKNLAKSFTKRYEEE